VRCGRDRTSDRWNDRPGSSAKNSENFLRISLDSFRLNPSQLSSRRCSASKKVRARDPKQGSKRSSDPFERVPEGSDVWCVSGRSWQGAISMAKKKKKAAKKVAKKKKGHG
jgi:hypothetical protein